MFHVEQSDKTEFCVKHFSFALEKFGLYVIMYIFNECSSSYNDLKGLHKWERLLQFQIRRAVSARRRPPFWLVMAITLQFSMGFSSFLFIWIISDPRKPQNTFWGFRRCISFFLEPKMQKRKSTGVRLLTELIGISPLPGTPPAP